MSIGSAMTGTFRLRSTLWAAMALCAACLAAAPLAAQEQGQTRAQGRPVDSATQPLYNPMGLSDVRDYREDMRTFIQDLSLFARRYRRDFIILPMGGIDLLYKSDFGEDRRLPATTYLRSIDGILVDGLYYGRNGTFGAPVAKQEKEGFEKDLEVLKEADERGVQVLVVDYTRNPKAIDESYRRNTASGFASYVAPDMGAMLGAMARIPARPWRENGDTIRTLDQVRNFLFLRDSSKFGTQAEFAEKIRSTNYDMVVVDPFHRRLEPLSRTTIDKLKFKKLGARRLVLAYVSIGYAEAWRYYFKGHWKEGNPEWLREPAPGVPDAHVVRYWDRSWQTILFGETDSYLYGLIRDLGFDGVVLGGADAYRYFEGG